MTKERMCNWIVLMKRVIGGDGDNGDDDDDGC